MPEQPAQEALAANSSLIRRRRGRGVVGRSIGSLRDGAIPKSLMWAMGVMKARVHLTNVIEMPEAEAKK